MSIYKKLFELQQEFKSKKDSFNTFGKYSYRNAEAMLTTLKPMLNEKGLILIFKEELVNYSFMKSTARLIEVETGEEISTECVTAIDLDLKGALKSGDKFTLSVLRMLKSEFIVESRKGSLHELTDEDALRIIKKQVKTRKDSIEEYKKYNKLETVKELEHEIEILNKYLPQEMSEEEIKKVIDLVFEEVKPTSMKDMGNLMKIISSKITNADMSLVSKIVKGRLS